jgi:hypothetical protein
MNVGGIPEHKCPPATETVGNPVVDPVDRKPVHPVDLELEQVRSPVADIVKGQGVELPPLRPDRPNQADATVPCQGKDGEEVSLVELDIDLAVE